MDHQCIPIEKQMSTIYTYENIRDRFGKEKNE